METRLGHIVQAVTLALAVMLQSASMIAKHCLCTSLMAISALVKNTKTDWPMMNAMQAGWKMQTNLWGGASW